MKAVHRSLQKPKKMEWQHSVVTAIIHEFIFVFLFARLYMPNPDFVSSFFTNAAVFVIAVFGNMIIYSTNLRMIKVHVYYANVIEKIPFLKFSCRKFQCDVVGYQESQLNTELFLFPLEWKSHKYCFIIQELKLTEGTFKFWSWNYACVIVTFQWDLEWFCWWISCKCNTILINEIWNSQDVVQCNLIMRTIMGLWQYLVISGCSLYQGKKQRHE